MDPSTAFIRRRVATTLFTFGPLSTLRSVGVGALPAQMVFNTEFSIMAGIGVILLIGIIKKNANTMIDFAPTRNGYALTACGVALRRCARGLPSSWASKCLQLQRCEAF